MPLTRWRSLALISAVTLTLATTLATGATRPRYGGTLRLEIRERVATLDPAEKPAGAGTVLQALIFDRLLRLDDNGRPQPGLALSWQSDPEQRRWEFHLRPGVKFHDGYPLTSAAVAGSVQRLVGESATVTASADGIVVQSSRRFPGLPALLATPAASIAGRGTQGDLVGTGPFRLTRFEAGRHANLAAFDDYWGGRPFLDSIDVEMGRSPRDQFIDLQVGKTDIAEIAPNEMRNAAERGARTWISAPVEVLALVFTGGRGEDARLREALALSIDRGAIFNVLLQRQGGISGALLPQWLSGYAFLFPATTDLARARQLVADIPAASRALTLGYDASDNVSRIIAERIAVNARDAGITLSVANPARTELRLTRVRFSSPDAGRALVELASALGLPEPRLPGDASLRPESLYNAERTMLEGFRVVPLFDLPEAYGVGARVRAWLKSGMGRMGDLRLADLWLQEKP